MASAAQTIAHVDDLVDTTIKNAVLAFILKYPTLDLDNAEAIVGQCSLWSEKLERYLLRAGIKAQLLRADGFLGEGFPEDAAEGWKNWRKDGYNIIWHMVVLVGDTVIDLTAAQFGPSHARRFLPLSEFRQAWQHGALLGPEGTFPKKFWD